MIDEFLLGSVHGKLAQLSSRATADDVDIKLLSATPEIDLAGPRQSVTSFGGNDDVIQYGNVYGE